MLTIDTDRRSVDFTLKEDILTPYLYGEEHLSFPISRHHGIVNDLLYRAFQRLIHENEAPAIIIADLLKEQEDSETE